MLKKLKLIKGKLKVTKGYVIEIDSKWLEKSNKPEAAKKWKKEKKRKLKAARGQVLIKGKVSQKIINERLAKS